jgi:predicted porin
MSKKTKLLVAGLVAGFACGASASGKAPTVTLGGSLDTQFGTKTEKNEFKSNASGQKLSTSGIVNDTSVHVKVDGAAHGMKYGGMIKVNADTSNSKVGEGSVAHQTMMYVESSMGKLEAGSYTGAYDAMKVSGASLARATGGIDGDWRFWANTDVDGSYTAVTGAGINSLIVSPTLPTAMDKSYSANASKVTYYSPIFAGFRLGVSYTPDTQQHGTVTNLKGLTKDYVTLSDASNQALNYKNVFQGGLSYKGKFDKVGFRFSALGEAGSAKKGLTGIGTHLSRHDLRAWELGAKVSYMGFGLAGSYGDWGKSGLAKSLTAGDVTTSINGAKSGKYWTAGANYVHHNYGVSFGYMNSENGGFALNTAATPKAYSPVKGKASVYSFGADYKVAPGFMPYAEISMFDLKDKTRDAAGKNKGTVFLAGSKLEF